jgi:small subunit ribosomal protein S21
METTQKKNVESFKITGNWDAQSKKLKSKFKQTKVVEELRERQSFEKPSVTRRNEIRKARYRQSKQKQD